jgi:hypothetical protein
MLPDTLNPRPSLPFIFPILSHIKREHTCNKTCNREDLQEIGVRVFSLDKSVRSTLLDFYKTFQVMHLGVQFIDSCVATC